MTQGFFITGTDTGVGKTHVALNLLSTLRKKNYTTAALKPLATGSAWTPDGLRNTDALALQAAATMKFAYQDVNPCVFREPIAPHIAAKKNRCSLTVQSLLQASQVVLQSQADYIVVEGLGGWQVPLNEKETLAHFAKALDFPVILVVGLRLGCLNHALLTWESIVAHGVEVAGWVANQIDATMIDVEENLEALQQRIQASLLAVIPLEPV